MLEIWNVIRWRMLAILVLFGVLSTLLIAALSVAMLNVVVRRESSYLIEERLKIITENDERLSASALQRIDASVAPLSSVQLISSYLNAIWPESHTSLIMASRQPAWLSSTSFNGMVADHGQLTIRSYHEVRHESLLLEIVADTPVTKGFLADLTKAAGVTCVADQTKALRPYRSAEGILGEIAANFIPGSRRPIPVVVTARNWKTGAREDWVICELRLNYSRTIEDLSRMGLQRASWLAPFGSIIGALVLVYVCGLVLSIRLSQRIGTAIDALSHAAQLVGDGDLTVQVAIPGRDQLGTLARIFNEMVRDIQALREQEKQTAVLEWDLSLAREVQEHLYPRTETVAAGVTLWGANTPARKVSGDLYEFFSFGPAEVGLLCADVSGKGVSAALMMAHLQALVHGRLLDLGEGSGRTLPAVFIAALNRDVHTRFESSRYVTLFYGEFDSRSGMFCYINAGHCKPIVINNKGEVTKLSGGDLPVGLFDDASYHAHETHVAKGTTILVYTDGLTDALDAQGESFGEEWLIAFCKSIRQGTTAQEIGALITEDIANWSAGVEQFDDNTLLVLSVA